ncbi:hypothetical protein, partial [Tetragenococcus halophilus]|uniref:hypothetical protein n=1 Tax=Tetragenococcus halophilus TaxID=51669 RepID=UPI0021BAE12E
TNLENIDSYLDTLISTVSISTDRFKDKNVVIIDDKERLKKIPMLLNNDNPMLDILKKYIAERSLLSSPS